MSNNLAGLNAYLDTALSDPSDTTWSSAEKDSVITWQVADLYPRYLYQFLHDDYTQALTAETYFYDINSAIVSVVRIDHVDADGNEFGPLQPGTWEIHGNLTAGTAEIHIAPTIVDNIGGTIRYAHAYGRYDTSSRLIPDELVPLVLARSRAELLRRVLHDRARFKAWTVAMPQQNNSMNEMIQMINEADADAAQLKAERRTWRLPMPARI